VISSSGRKFVNPAERLHRRAEQTLDVRLLCEVRLHRQCPPRFSFDLGNDTVRSLATRSLVDHDGRTVRSEPFPYARRVTDLAMQVWPP
jgi:hypothetical protein